MEMEGEREKALSRGEIRGLVMCQHHVIPLAALGRAANDGVGEGGLSEFENDLI
jgi:hypothetical protein